MIAGRSTMATFAARQAATRAHTQSSWLATQQLQRLQRQRAQSTYLRSAVAVAGGGELLRDLEALPDPEATLLARLQALPDAQRLALLAAAGDVAMHLVEAVIQTWRSEQAFGTLVNLILALIVLKSVLSQPPK